jgi:hypothetical protein
MRIWSEPLSDQAIHLTIIFDHDPRNRIEDRLDDVIEIARNRRGREVIDDDLDARSRRGCVGADRFSA